MKFSFPQNSNLLPGPIRTVQNAVLLHYVPEQLTKTLHESLMDYSLGCFHDEKYLYK